MTDDFMRGTCERDFDGVNGVSTLFGKLTRAWLGSNSDLQNSNNERLKRDLLTTNHLASKLTKPKRKQKRRKALAKIARSGGTAIFVSNMATLQPTVRCSSPNCQLNVGAWLRSTIFIFGASFLIMQRIVQRLEKNASARWIRSVSIPIMNCFTSPRPHWKPQSMSRNHIFWP